MPTSPKQHSEAGATPESAIRIHAANSFEGIPKEYAILIAMFGTMDNDWKLIDRRVIHADDGRDLERFVISFRGERKEVYFDITGWLHKNTPDDRRSLEKVMARHDKPLTILLPKEELFTLWLGLLHLTESQLDQIGLSLAERKDMLDPCLDALKPYGADYAAIPAHVSVTALFSVWRRILMLLTQWKPADLLQEEEIENLKAIIGGTMRDARR